MEKEMNSEKIKVFMHQFDGARLSFDQRRSYQLKLGFAIWSAFLAMIFTMVKGQDIGVQHNVKWIIPFIGWLVFIAHSIFLWYSQRAGKVDQKKAECYENLLNEICEVPNLAWNPVQEAIIKTQKGPSKGKWIEIVHILISFALVVTLTILV